MKRFLLAGAWLQVVASFVRFWARCAKRRRQEAMIHLAYERALITKAEIDTMLKQVDEFDGSCLSVIAERPEVTKRPDFTHKLRIPVIVIGHSSRR
jgi:hypothetical protein